MRLSNSRKGLRPGFFPEWFLASGPVRGAEDLALREETEIEVLLPRVLEATPEGKAPPFPGFLPPPVLAGAAAVREGFETGGPGGGRGLFRSGDRARESQSPPQGPPPSLILPLSTFSTVQSPMFSPERKRTMRREGSSSRWSNVLAGGLSSSTAQHSLPRQ
ncbi:hypothetical protein [Thermosulfurimonas sp. F29]|uniref:hypothetical protein n=1 Tax=Thermosulfurimonas sp. F29 TaxID=2867247 RepID=UPI001C8337D7|nr:hypothetical protein [Thermosulfurimonas sp. F29]MBX6424282.1 hypothetical protein [Thermosulfurimonas sp. F29]